MSDQSPSSEHVPQQVDDTIPIAGSKRTTFEFRDFDHSSIPLEEERWPVIIIGSSMVGMTMGVLLGFHGIKSVSFDRHPSTAIHPRAALFLLRSVEIFRQLGLDRRFRENSALNFDLNAGMLISDKLIGGKILASLQESMADEVAKVTPAVRLWLTQNMFEPLLRESAKDFGASQRFGESIVHYEEQPDGVIVVVQNLATKQYRKYKADYLVATDGNRSATRKKEDIFWDGPGLLGSSISVNFRADLRPYLGTRAKHGVTYITNPKVDAGFRLESEGRAGFMIVTRGGGRDNFPPDSVTAADARRYFFDAAGLDHEIPIEVDSINYWSIAAFNSERMSSKGGRVFIAGDAAHVMPPTGGMGGNTGIQDVYNLAWKLAYVLNGKASPQLLKTYDVERQPVNGFLMRQAYSRFQRRVARTEADEPELPDIICEIGYRYPAGAVVPGKDNETTSPLYEDPYSPLVTAGSRLPHMDIVDSSDMSRHLSTLDLVKQNFTLLAVDSSSPWVNAASHPELKLDSYVLNKHSAPFKVSQGTAREIFKLGDGEALLVRPDGYIAWRASKVECGHAESLKETLETILHNRIK